MGALHVWLSSYLQPNTKDVSWLVCLCVVPMGELCKNGWTDQDVIWVWTCEGQRNHGVRCCSPRLTGTSFRRTYWDMPASQYTHSNLAGWARGDAALCWHYCSNLLVLITFLFIIAGKKPGQWFPANIAAGSSSYVISLHCCERQLSARSLNTVYVHFVM